MQLKRVGGASSDVMTVKTPRNLKEFADKIYRNDPQAMLDAAFERVSEIADSVGLDWGKSEKNFVLGGNPIKGGRAVSLLKEHKGKLWAKGEASESRTGVIYPTITFRNRHGELSAFFSGIKWLKEEYARSKGIEQPVITKKSSAKAKKEAAERKAEEEERREQAKREEAYNKIASLFNTASLAISHPYIAAKRINQDTIKALDLRIIFSGLDKAGRGPWLCYQLKNSEGVISYQTISSDQPKSFKRPWINKEGDLKGAYAVIGDEGHCMSISEGIADAAACYQTTNTPSVIALDAGNLPRVADHLAGIYEGHNLFVAGDNDEAGLKACRDARLRYSVPDGYKDFNDLYIAEGSEAVKKQLSNVTGEKYKADYVSLSKAGDIIAKTADDFFSNPYKDGKPRVVAINASAGIGKSTQSIMSAVKSCKKVAWYTPTVTQAYETRIPGSAVIRGRTHNGEGFTTLCREAEKMNLLGSSISTQSRLCFDPETKEKCFHYGQCEYNRQFWKAHERVRLYSHANMSAYFPRVDEFRPEVAVIDENFINEFVRSNHIKGSMITYEKQGTHLFELIAVHGSVRNRAAPDEPILKYLLDAIPDLEEQLRAGISGYRESRPAIKPNMKTETIAEVMSSFNRNPYPYRLAKIMLEDIEAGRLDSQRVWVTSSAIHYSYLKHPVRLDNIPVLILDGTADTEILSRFWPQIEVVNAKVRRKTRQVIQVSDREISNSYLSVDDEAHTERNISASKSFRNKFTSWLKLRVKHEGNGLVIGPMSFIQTLDIPDGVQANWFGNVRGSNEYKGCSWVAVVGRNQRGGSPAESMARAIFHDDEQPLAIHEKSFRKEYSGIRHQNGRVTYTESRYHQDERIQAVERLIRESETEQSIDRLRLIHGEAKPVYLFSCLPVDIDVTETAPCNSVLGDERLNTMLLSKDTLILSPSWMVKNFPGLFKTKRTADRWLQNNLFSEKVRIPKIPYIYINGKVGILEKNEKTALNPLVFGASLFGKKGKNTKILSVLADEKSVKNSIFSEISLEVKELVGFDPVTRTEENEDREIMVISKPNVQPPEYIYDSDTGLYYVPATKRYRVCHPVIGLRNERANE